MSAGVLQRCTFDRDACGAVQCTGMDADPPCCDADAASMKCVTHEELSHGLRTPLTSVVGFSGTLIDRWHELADDERIVFVQMVYAEALRLAHSIEQLDRQLYHEFAAKNARSGAFKGLHGLADAS
jgi:hypothetical protein